jgi:hypothetical protein
MGRIRTNKSSVQQAREANDAFFNAVHRGRVHAVHIDKGTVEVVFDGFLYSREVTFPLLGLSYPPKKSDEDTTNVQATSWGRYIPQEGDMLLIGFSTTGEAFALGYSAIFYEGFKYQDDVNAAIGGIGWGESAGKRLQPGDWDFKSANGCFLYMGDKVKLSSGPHSIYLDQTMGDITTTSGLVQDSYGEASTRRKGDARRYKVPTDAAETYIFSIIPANSGKTAQESYDSVCYSLAGGIPIEMSRIHQGEVIDDLTMTPMVPALNTSLKPLTLMVGTGVRMLHSVKDPSGMTDFYISAIDDLGNYGVSAPTAVGFQWMTPAATWQINNLTTTYTSTATYSLTSPAITLTGATSITLSGGTLSLTGTTSATITAPTISALGTVILGTTGGLPVAKLSPAFIGFWTAYFTAAAAAWAKLAAEATIPASAASCTTAGTAAGAMVSLLASAAATTTTVM